MNSKIYGIIVLAATWVCGAFGSISAQVNAEQVLAIGRNVLSMEDYMLSIQYFNQAIKAKPYLADPYFFRALAKLELEDYNGAVQDATLAIERNKFKVEAYKLRGFALQCMGRDSLAIEDYDIGLRHNPIDKYFLFYKAVAQTERKDYSAADSTFSTLLRHFPNFEDGYGARARLYLQQADTTAALTDLRRSLEISRTLLNSHLLLAEIEGARQNWPEARAAMDEAIKLRPQEPSLYVNRAFVRYNTDDYFGAMADYNYALDLDADYVPALFNRALLRYEVKDLEASAQDMTHVLSLEPNNFHARYNRGLVLLEEGKAKEALSDFEAIAKKYPRFYPVHYAIAEARQQMGDLRGANQSYFRAEELVNKYVENPEQNPLDRPAIAAATSNSEGEQRGEDETDSDVMDRFNRLVTVSAGHETALAFNDKIKGRVQDRDVRVEPEPMYALSLSDTRSELRSLSNYFRELEDLNRRGYLKQTIYLSNHPESPSEAARLERLFRAIDDYTAVISAGNARPVDFLGRAVHYTEVKNYDAALADFNQALEMDPNFVVALMGRAYLLVRQAENPGDLPDADASMVKNLTTSLLQSAVNDLDAALRLDPRLIYAWFNKGNIYYGLGDYTAAIQCYTEALRLDADFGQAFYNRGLAYLSTGNKNAAFADLGRAGELGILPSYNLLKRMK